MKKHNNLYVKIETHYRENYKVLVRRAQGQLGSLHKAEDAVQSAYTNALQYLDSYNEVESFDTWFFTILSNTIRHEHSVDKITSIPEDMYSTVSPAQLHASQLGDVVKLIKNEPENKQRIIKLGFIQGYTSKEINDLVPEAYGTVRNILTSFRHRLETVK